MILPSSDLVKIAENEKFLIVLPCQGIPPSQVQSAQSPLNSAVAIPDEGLKSLRRSIVLLHDNRDGKPYRMRIVCWKEREYLEDHIRQMR